ncbi:MAG: hypothetical protein JSR91_00135 [Proteobacteria bacterium]|nr:hypothetical protein [Pseudomonadota bacterium]
MALHSCVTPTAWSEKPLGIYPPSAGALNGPSRYLFGVRVPLPLDPKVNR